jgi:hypothetical protein
MKVVRGGGKAKGCEELGQTSMSVDEQCSEVIRKDSLIRGYSMDMDGGCLY